MRVDDGGNCTSVLTLFNRFVSTLAYDNKKSSKISLIIISIINDIY